MGTVKKTVQKSLGDARRKEEPSKRSPEKDSKAAVEKKAQKGGAKPKSSARASGDAKADKFEKAVRPEKAAKIEKEPKTEKAERKEKDKDIRPMVEDAGRLAKDDKVDGGEKKPVVQDRPVLELRRGDPDAAASPCLPRKKDRAGPCMAKALDDESFDGCSGAKSSSSSSGCRSKRRRSRSGSDSPQPTRRRESLGAASGFGLASIPPPPSLPGTGTEATEFGGSGQLAVLPEKVQGLLNSGHLANEMARMKQAVEVRQHDKDRAREQKDEAESRTVLKMPSKLHAALLHPDNTEKLLARTGLASAALNGQGLVALRAHSPKGLQKALSQLRRVAYHCQWGCSTAKVGALLSEKPLKPTSTMVVRLAATSSRLQSHEAKLTFKVRKLRVGTQAGACNLVIEGVPGLSRRHCTITFEPEKGTCYLQDLSTNGTYLNGKRLPRPPYKHPQDARVRLFHGDEMLFKLRIHDGEELGYVVNLLELS